MTKLVPYLVFVLMFKMAESRIDCPLPLEKGAPRKFTCNASGSTRSVTWQVKRYNTTMILSTCNFTTGTCTDNVPTVYRSSLSNTGNVKKSYLDISSTRTEDQQFSCVTDTNVVTDMCYLRLYMWPMKPTCTQSAGNVIWTYTCVTSNTYPKTIRYWLNRRKENFGAKDYTSNCEFSEYGQGSLGDYNATCTFQVLMEKMLPENIVYANLLLLGTNVPLEKKITPVQSDDIVTSFSVPKLSVNVTECPFGEGVKESKIKIGTNATCKCVLSSPEIISMFSYEETARWYNKTNQVVGVEETFSKTSILTVGYNASDKEQVFTCRPYIRLKVVLNGTEYRPVFYSVSSTASRLQPLVTITVISVLKLLSGFHLQN